MNNAVILLATPMILEMLLASLLAVTDIYFIAGYGAKAIASVGLTEAALSFLYVFVLGIGTATTAIIARRVGEKQLSQANILAGQSLLIGGIIAVIISTLGVIYSLDILLLMGAEVSTAEYGKSYTEIIFAGSSTIILLFLMNAIFRGAGNAKLTLRALLLANGLNLLLDPLLIFGFGPIPEMGIDGAAIASVISRGAGICYLLWKMYKGQSAIVVHIMDLKPQLIQLMKLLKLSVGSTLNVIVLSASWVALVRLIAVFGSEAQAGYTVALRVIMFVILPASGLCGAAATLVGQYIGAGKPDSAEQAVWRIAKYNVCYMLFISLVFLGFSYNIIGLFTTDVTVLHYGSHVLVYMSYSYILFAIGMVLMQAFNGAGDTFTPTKITFIFSWIFQLPCAYWLAVQMDFGANGIFMVMALAQALMGVAAIVIFRQGHWKHKIV